METQTEKKGKPTSKKVVYTAIRVRKELKRQIESGLERLNKKDFGRRIRMEDYLGLVLTLLTDEHIARLQEASLSNSDRLERDYREYVTQHGQITRDEYLGKRLSGEIAEKTAAH
ncbi:MAG: hypothetical protein RJB38_857 [Pseudomonadota bacterium]|jgi:hypothetical protein